MEVQIKEENNKIYGLFSDVEFMLRLRREFKIVPMPIGTIPHASGQNKCLGPPFVLNKYQVRYL